MGASIAPASAEREAEAPAVEDLAELPLPPGPRGLPLVGVAPLLMRDLYGYLPRLAEEYGDVVSVPLPGITLISVSHPDHVRHVMNRHAHRYWKGTMTEALRGGDPPALPFREGADHKRVRKTMNPHFSERALASVAELMADEIVGQVDRWDDDPARFDLDERLNVLSMAVLLRAIFTTAPAGSDLHDLVHAMRDVGRAAAVRGMMASLPGLIPRPLEARDARAKAVALAYIDRMIAARSQSTEEHQDLLSAILGLAQEGGTLDDATVRSELMILLFAGHETTATALGWTLALLATNPEACRRAYDEVDALGGHPPTYADIPRLTWLRACFDEAQRIQAAPMTGRAALVDDVIGGYRIPKGAYVAVPQYGLHHDSRFWHAPERFAPERFLGDEIDPYAFIPFGVGPRRCIGMRMAYIEAVIALAAILRAYTFAVPAEWIPRREYRISTGIKGGVPLSVQRR